MSGNGTLSGDGKSGKSSIQCTVSETEAGKSITVTAVPGSNYQFTRWSDGVTKATRTDTNFNTSKTLTAYFEKVTVPEYSVIYRVSGSGSLEMHQERANFNIPCRKEAGRALLSQQFRETTIILSVGVMDIQEQLARTPTLVEILT